MLIGAAIVIGLLVIRGPGGTQPLAAGARTTCGDQRWPVKTLSDPRERLVNYKPHDSSIALGAMPVCPCGMSKNPTPVMFALPLRSVKWLEEG